MSEDIDPANLKSVVCGNCGTKVEEGFKRNDEIWVRCSSCGQEDTVETAQREAATYAARKALSGMLGGMSSSNIKVTTPPMPHFRWKVAD